MHVFLMLHSYVDSAIVFDETIAFEVEVSARVCDNVINFVSHTVTKF